jgi:hypothetical protein
MQEYTDPISYWKEKEEWLILKLQLSTVFVWNQFTPTTFYQNSNYYAGHKFQEILPTNAIKRKEIL